MTEGRRAAWLDSHIVPTALALMGAVAATPACAPSPQALAVVPERAPDALRDLPLRPPVASVVRDGDPRAALSVAVLTAGIDDAAGPRLPVALAAVTDARLAASGLPDVTVAATWDGYRIRVLLPGDGDSARAVHAVRDALLTPVLASTTDVAAASKKLALLAQRPLGDPDLAPLARCAETPVAIDHEPAPDAATLERWRAASDGLGRVVFGAAGTARDVDGVAAALLGLPAWPTAQAVERRIPTTWPAFRVYDASSSVAGGAARISVVVRGGSALASTRAATRLGAPDGPLAVRLHGLDASARVRDVTATALAGGGCLTVTLDLPRVERRHDADADVTVTAAVMIARQEARLAIAYADAVDHPVRSATLPGDPRDAAELAAWWALMSEAPATTPGPGNEAAIIGLGSAEDSPDFASRAKDLTRTLERADTAWAARIVDARRDIERGQGSVWMLLASPCGTLAEGDSDAGLTALAVSALAEQARAAGQANAEISEWITVEGAGLIARATRRDGESSLALARRVADAVGAAMMTATVTGSAIGRARAELMTTLSEDDARSFATLAEALAPGHPSWSFPLAGRGLEAWPDGAVLSRISALRHGPLRVAILGNDDATQVEAATLAVDRWIPRSSPVERACAAHSAPVTPRAGTYVAPPAVAASAWLAVPVPEPARGAASVVAAALDGPDGLLAHALSSGLASAWSARVVGPSDATALAIHVRAPGPTLDAAVAQVRALLDRLRQGGFTEENRAHASASLTHASLTASLDPRERLVRLWRGDDGTAAIPSLDALHTFLANDLHDDSLVIVVTRPPVARSAP